MSTPASQEQIAEGISRGQHLFYDDLTGLNTRLILLDRLSQLLSQMTRHGTSFALLITDLTNFRFINSAHGHPAGDRMLVEFAQRLCSVTRSTDTVARIGGDEFAILLPDCPTPADALKCAQRLQSVLQAPCLIDGEPCAVLVDVGIAMAEWARSAEEMTQQAWEALYQVKAAESQIGIGLFDSGLSNQELSRRAMLDELRRALVRDELTVGYQPIVDIVTGQASAVEALLRWTHPVHGPIPPERFIAIAEQSGLISEIGAWVLQQACQAALAWDGLAVHVNVSAYQLAHSALADVVTEALKTLPPERLVVEITESAAVRDVGQRRIHELHALGVGVAIDDFGRGYSSLASLRRIPAHILKIDQMFIEHLATSREDQAVVRAIIEMARAIGLAVVAEGVETADQLGMLREIGLSQAQGYYWSPCVLAAEVPALVQRLAAQ